MLKGLMGILRSRKGMAALLGIVGLIAVQLMNVDPESAKALTGQIMTIVTVFIGATAAEDAAYKFGNGKNGNGNGNGAPVEGGSDEDSTST